jgi:hypothetical protein
MWSARDFDAIDGRLLEAREEKRIIRELSDHCGGRPSAPQAMLIKRTARSLIILSILEKRVLEKHDLGDLEARQMIALTNSVRLNLVAAGPEAGRGAEDVASLHWRQGGMRGSLNHGPADGGLANLSGSHR